MERLMGNTLRMLLMLTEYPSCDALKDVVKEGQGLPEKIRLRTVETDCLEEEDGILTVCMIPRKKTVFL